MLENLTPAARNLLATLLARTDALFLPLRWTHGTSPKNAAAIAARRAAFGRSGIEWRFGGTARERKAFERDLQAVGPLLTIYGMATRRTGLALAPPADAELRGLCALPGPCESVKVLRRMAKFTDEQTNAGYVAEVDLLNSSYAARGIRERLIDLEEALLPSLVRGWSDSASDSEGRVGYALTAAGRKALASERPPPDPEQSGELGDVYLRELQAELASRATWLPSRPNTIAIPLSCGDWPARQRPKPKVATGQ